MNIILVDDHALFREGLSMVLQQLGENCIVHQAETGEEAMALINKVDDIDIVLLDYNLPDTNGLILLPQMKAINSGIPVALLSGENSGELIQKSIQLGASGFVTKNATSEVMLNAIRLILGGGIYIPPDIFNGESTSQTAQEAQSAPQEIDSVATNLTPRQKEVLVQLAQGLANKEIARELHMSPSTVKVHIAAILRELEVKNRTQAASMARELGIV